MAAEKLLLIETTSSPLPSLLVLSLQLRRLLLNQPSEAALELLLPLLQLLHLRACSEEEPLPSLLLSLELLHPQQEEETSLEEEVLRQLLNLLLRSVSGESSSHITASRRLIDLT